MKLSQNCSVQSSSLSVTNLPARRQLIQLRLIIAKLIYSIYKLLPNGMTKPTILESPVTFLPRRLAILGLQGDEPCVASAPFVLHFLVLFVLLFCYVFHSSGALKMKESVLLPNIFCILLIIGI